MCNGVQHLTPKSENNLLNKYSEFLYHNRQGIVIWFLTIVKTYSVFYTLAVITQSHLCSDIQTSARKFIFIYIERFKES